MAKPIPYRWIKGLSQEAQRDIERNFLALQVQITPTKVYDAYVDPLAVANNTDTRIFTTPFAAIKYVVDTLGQTWANIGWLKPTTGANSIAQEQGNYVGTNTCYVAIDVIGADAVGDFTGGNLRNAVQWDLQSFTDGGKFARLHIREVWLNSNLASPSSPFTNAGAEIAAENCYFNFNAHGRLCNNASTSFFRDCFFQGVSWGSTSPTVVYARDCIFYGLGNEIITQSFVHKDCHYSNFGNAPGPVLQGVFYILDNANFTQYPSGAAISLGTLNFNSTNTSRIYITSAGEESFYNQTVSVVISAAISYVWIEGRFWNLTVSAPAFGSVHFIHAQLEGAFDITGPASIAIAAVDSSTPPPVGNFLRGEALSGSVDVMGSNSANIALSFVGVHDSVITATFQAYGAAGTGQAYAIDAGSSNNAIIVAGHDLFSVGSTNASTTTVVINHSGAPGIDTTAVHYTDYTTFANLKGAMGEPGNDGEDGFGNPGAPGQPGAAGVAGAPGSMGPMSEPGDDGVEGFPGPAGNPGIQGIQGLLGPQGAPGSAMGPPGEPGDDGVEGFPGPAGNIGPGGIQGVPGPQGQAPLGHVGIDGDPGEDGFMMGPSGLLVPAGSFGQVPLFDAAATPTGIIYGSPDSLASKYLKPNFSYETFPRSQSPVNGASLISGTIALFAVALPKDFPFGHITFVSATTAAVTPTHWWFALCNSSFLQLRGTADQLTAAWPANTVKTLALASTFNTTYEGIHYLALMMTATTVITTLNATLPAVLSTIGASLVVTGLTAQTVVQVDGANLAPAPGGATAIPWGYINN